jgi:hypothetical protein
MNINLILPITISMIFSANMAYAQFHWNHPLNASGSITTENYDDTKVIVVTGSSASDRVEVESFGGSALIKLYSNEQLITQKFVQPISNGLGMLPGSNPQLSIPSSGKELWLKCKLKAGDDSFLCKSTIFDQIEVYAGEGDDTIFAGPARTYAFGDAGDDFVVGGPSQDYLSGDEGNDWISGGEGDDWIIGGSGQDFVASHGQSANQGSDQVYTGGWFAPEDNESDYYSTDSTDSLYAGWGDVGTITVRQ